MATIGTLFSGGGGADVGAMAAGLTPLWGIEYDDAIASVARANLGDHVITADILDVDPSTLLAVDVLHASPPCQNASVAKADRGETSGDMALASKVVQFVEELQPRVFTLENVYGYRKFEAWRMIEDALHGSGYWVHMAHVNAADMGVPQTRKRMIVRAVRGGWVPYLPAPVRWVGWYEAIEDILHTLPDSQFANWQLERLPAELRETVLLANGSYENLVMAGKNEPSNTITSNHNQLGLRAFLIPSENSRYGTGDPTVIDAGNPSATLRSGRSNPARALINGRVVSMTPRALARFQSFPDWYKLPDKKTLAARIIGNAVPPLLYQRIIEPLVDGI